MKKSRSAKPRRRLEEVIIPLTEYRKPVPEFQEGARQKGETRVPERVAKSMDIPVPDYSSKYKKVLQVSKKDVIKRPGRRIHHSIHGYEGDYQIDIMFLKYKYSAKYKRINHGYTCILLAVEVPTRFCYAVPMKSKSATEVVDSFKKIHHAVINEGKIMLNITSDEGSEFNNSEWDAVMRELSISQYVKEPGDRFSMGIIDRLCLTLKEWIFDWQTEHDSLSWYDALPEIVEKYNVHQISTLKATPNELREYGTKYEEAQTLTIERDKKANEKRDKFNVGDRVRIRLKPDDIAGKKASKLTKGSERWSNEIYFIDRKEGNSFYLTDVWGNEAPRSFRHYDLLKASDESTDVPNLRRSVQSESRTVRRQRQ